MLAIGAIVILAAAVIGLGGFWLTTSNTTPMYLSAGPFAIDVAPVAVFVAGLLAMGLLWLGWTLLRSGTKRTVRQRREHRQLLKDQRQQEKELAATRARLAQEEMSSPVHVDPHRPVPAPEHRPEAPRE